VVCDVGGIRVQHRIKIVGGLGDAGVTTVYVDGADGSTVFEVVPRFPLPDEAGLAGSLAAPMPGSIVRIRVEVGDPVVAGQPLVALEAMKMEHQVLAPCDGIVAEILVEPGQQVDTGQPLLRLEGLEADE
jgi:propionyl-CoA carboxylase alpha chain